MLGDHRVLCGDATVLADVEQVLGGQLADMTWSVGEVLAHLSRLFELRAGDLVFTGTPAGVGPLKPGDHLRGGIDGLQPVSFLITPVTTAGAAGRVIDSGQGGPSGVGADCKHWPDSDLDV